MTIDRNRIKLELLNFRNYAEIYADSRNLITEYERNDNKITTAERHDIRLTKLEKNAKAKIPFKELFDRYAELKASDTNPFFDGRVRIIAYRTAEPVGKTSL